MREESTNLDLEYLTEQTAEQIIFVVGSTPGDTKAAVMRLLCQYLEQAQGQAYEEALRGILFRASLRVRGAFFLLNGKLRLTGDVRWGGEVSLS